MELLHGYRVDDLLNLRVLSRRLHETGHRISSDTVKQAIAKGLGPVSIKPGRDYLVRWSDGFAWAENRPIRRRAAVPRVRRPPIDLSNGESGWVTRREMHALLVAAGYSASTYSIGNLASMASLGLGPPFRSAGKGVATYYDSQAGLAWARQRELERSGRRNACRRQRQ
jgi:hypothetical protein